MESENGQSGFDAQLVEDLNRRIMSLQDEEQELHERINELGRQRKRYEKARSALMELPKPVGQSVKPAKKYPKGVSQHVMDDVFADIRRYAEDHEEFRQVDIRLMPDASVTSSSKIATAFEKLRQANMIRMARVDGNSKFYRLTREALKESVDEPTATEVVA